MPFLVRYRFLGAGPVKPVRFKHHCNFKAPRQPVRLSAMNLQILANLFDYCCLVLNSVGSVGDRHLFINKSLSTRRHLFKIPIK